jgi:hypothetical protein
VIERAMEPCRLSRHFERDTIPHALETEGPVGAGFEPLHLGSQPAQDSRPRGGTRTCAS